MKTAPKTPRIIEAERLEDGVIITFDDGKHAVYPASLLHATLPEAEQIDKSEPDEKATTTAQQKSLIKRNLT